MFQPQKVLITRHGNDSFHERLQQAPGLMMAEPKLGHSLQIFLENGKIMTTIAVTHVANDGDDTVIDTRNSTYRLKLAS